MLTFNKIPVTENLHLISPALLRNIFKLPFYHVHNRRETEHAQNFVEANERCKTTVLFLQYHIVAELVKII